MRDRELQVSSDETFEQNRTILRSGCSLFLTAVLSLVIYDFRRPNSILRRIIDDGLKRLLVKAVDDDTLAERIRTNAEQRNT